MNTSAPSERVGRASPVRPVDVGVARPASSLTVGQVVRGEADDALAVDHGDVADARREQDPR